MKDIIIINAYPNNEFKISLLEQQLFNFKQLGIKIMVVSGCDVPEKLRSSIDYLIINTDNIRIDKDHTYKCMFELKMKDTAYLHTLFHNCAYGIYDSHVNVTICKNIKLSFKMAQILGYKNAFYTEDDHIFKIHYSKQQSSLCADCRLIITFSIDIIYSRADESA